MVGEKRKIQILLVEDDDSLRFLTAKQLKRLGFDAVVAQDGLEALNKVTVTTYNIILMDVMMPGMDGIELTRKIREMEKAQNLPRVPIIGMTAYHDRQRCLDAGMDDYLFKPVLLDALSDMLARWHVIPKEAS